MKKQIIICAISMAFFVPSGAAFAAKTVPDSATAIVIEIYKETLPILDESETSVEIEKAKELACFDFIHYLRRTGLSRWSRRR